jgi:hypothetical protein
MSGPTLILLTGNWERYYCHCHSFSLFLFWRCSISSNVVHIYLSSKIYWFINSDLALGCVQQQGVAKPKGPLEALRPKLQVSLVLSTKVALHLIITHILLHVTLHCCCSILFWFVLQPTRQQQQQRSSRRSVYTSSENEGTRSVSVGDAFDSSPCVEAKAKLSSSKFLLSELYSCGTGACRWRRCWC